MRIQLTRRETRRVTEYYDFTYELEDLERFIKQYEIEAFSVEELVDIIEREDDLAVRKVKNPDGTSFDLYVYDVICGEILDNALNHGAIDTEYSDDDWDYEQSVKVIYDDEKEAEHYCRCNCKCDPDAKCEECEEYTCNKLED